VSYRTLKVAGFLALISLVGVMGMAVTWVQMGRTASRASELALENEGLKEREARLLTLAQELAELERRYEDLRGLFAIEEGARMPPDLWLPPSGRSSGRAGRSGESNQSRPTSWPLPEAGFITQGLHAGDGGEHPGLDIAVPTDTYILAAGAATVQEVGEDPVYGRYVVLDHGDGYQTRYAHASSTLVSEGASVRRGEVIALTGSTGQSTAPHLHFEVLRQGEAVDPLTMVRQP
jgi:murein DD-endopeptidase MepM/ murein hydrolase activator NlpD